jgi:hypothetical protein
MQELIKANADIDLKPGNQFAGAVFLDVELASTRYVFQGKSQLGNTGFYVGFIIKHTGNF